MANWYVIDSSVVFRDPVVLTWSPSHEIVLNSTLMALANTQASKKIELDIRPVLNLVINGGALLVDPVIGPMYQLTPKEVSQLTPSPSYSVSKDKCFDVTGTAKIGIELAEKYGIQNVKIITDNAEMRAVMESRGFICHSYDDFSENLVSEGKIFSQLEHAYRSGALSIKLIAFLGVPISFLILWSYQYWGNQTALVPHWIVISVVILLGILLFLARALQRLLYGCFEFGAGIFLAFDALPSHIQAGLADFSGLLKMLSGLYVIVRALDNIDKGLGRFGFKQCWGWTLPRLQHFLVMLGK